MQDSRQHVHARPTPFQRAAPRVRRRGRVAQVSNIHSHCVNKIHGHNYNNLIAEPNNTTHVINDYFNSITLKELQHNMAFIFYYDYY